VPEESEASSADVWDSDDDEYGDSDDDEYGDSDDDEYGDSDDDGYGDNDDDDEEARNAKRARGYSMEIDSIGQEVFEGSEAEKASNRESDEGKTEVETNTLGQELIMQPLSTHDKDKVSQALNDTGPSTQLIAEDGLNSVKRGSLQTLLPKTYLNDEVVNFYTQVPLTKRDEKLCREDPSGERKRCHFFQSFFMTKLLDIDNTNPAIAGNYKYSNVKRWSKKVPGTRLVVSACVFALDVSGVRSNHSHEISIFYRSRHLQFGQDLLSHQRGERSLGLRCHLHAGKAHPSLRFDGQPRDELLEKSIRICQRRTSRDERVATSGPKPVEAGPVYARHSAPVEWYVSSLTEVFACSFCYSIYSHFIFRFGSITNQELTVESSLACLLTLLAGINLSTLTKVMRRNAGNA
jgi:hypothetical protein